MLLSLILLPIIGALILKTLNENKRLYWGLILMLLNLMNSLVLAILYNSNSAQFQFQEYGLGIDGLSLILIILTTMLMPIVLLVQVDMLIILLLIEGILLAVFMVLDILIFYLCFESVLIPLFFLIGWYKGRSRRLWAGLSLFIYTLAGSFFMLLAILVLYLETSTTNYSLLLTIPINYNKQLLLFIGFFIAFAVKVPMVPFHLWLPEAHVESPTGGSVLLAGILLKLGGYGLLRFCIPLFPYACNYFLPFISSLSIIGIIYAGLTALRQTDLKKIIAYSSVSHMNLAILGIFANQILAIEGAILMMIAHGLVSSGLFILVGALYSRYSTRLVRYYRGLTAVMPVFAILFMIFTLSNIAFPLSANFISEFLILAGLFDNSPVITIIACSGMLISAGYSMWLFNRIAFGGVTSYITHFNDLSRFEIFSLLVLIIPTIILGIKSNIILDLIHFPAMSLIY